jgi:hypothetical protein
MNSIEFRKELVKLMPGYTWTVHQSTDPDRYISATGIQSSGFNRLSTLQIERRDRISGVEYEAKSSGYGKHCPWLSSATGATLAQALRHLQDFYEERARTYQSGAFDLKNARKVKKEPPCSSCTSESTFD